MRLHMVPYTALQNHPYFIQFCSILELQNTEPYEGNLIYKAITKGQCSVNFREHGNIFMLECACCLAQYL
jgi:hypothetical protein